MTPAKTNAQQFATPAWSWLLLLKAPAIALRGRVMLLAAVGVIAVWLLDALVGYTPTEPLVDAIDARGGFAGTALATVEHMARDFVGPFVDIVQNDDVLSSVLACFARLAVWGFLGGAIVRMAALSLTRDEDPNLEAALRFTWQQRAGFFGGPVLLLTGLAAMALPLLVVRLAMEVSWLATAIAVIWPVVIVVAIVATLYGVAALAGWPLVWAAAAVDGSDSFDAVSRMFAYLYQKPLRLLGYALVLAVVAAASAGVASGFMIAVDQVSEFAAGTPDNAWALTTIAGWNAAALSLIVVYLTALVWTSGAALYLLRRQDVDGVHVDEVFIDPQEFDGGIPPLREGPTGVPEFDDQSDAA